MQTPPHIVLSGITGLKKLEIANKFRQHVTQKLNISPDDTSIPVISADVPHLSKWLGMEPSARSSTLHQIYDDALAAIDRAKQNKETRCIIVSMHLTFMDMDRTL